MLAIVVQLILAAVLKVAVATVLIGAFVVLLAAWVFRPFLRRLVDDDDADDVDATEGLW